MIAFFDTAVHRQLKTANRSVFCRWSDDSDAKFFISKTNSIQKVPGQKHVDISESIKGDNHGFHFVVFHAGDLVHLFG
jgi:hypothetical protein